MVQLLVPGYAQTRQKAFEVNQRLGRGINMGNCFEAPSETAWGNPWKPEYFRIMSQLGFQHVRIPVRWEPAERSLPSPPYTIYGTFMARIKAVVDTALKYKLQPIINMHHHDTLMKYPDAGKARFLALWSQIATAFKGYPDSLIFEVLNEPNGNMTAAKWNVFLKDALSEIRKISPERMVMIGTADWGGVAGLSSLQLPDDENIILTVHYYNPFQFTHQGAEWSANSSEWLGTKWLDTSDERKAVEQDFAAVRAFSQEEKIPVHVGEFGAYSKADIDSRARWSTFLSRYFEQQGFSWAYWEFCAGFGIYDRNTGQYLMPIVNALLHNPMPLPGTYAGQEIFLSTFTAGTEGWSIVNQSGGASTISASSGVLLVNISAPGSENWHIQLNKYKVNLEKDKTYRISFKALAESARTITVYAGMNASPWSAYSGYSSFQVGTSRQDFSFVFTMKSSSDPNARITFDLGKNVSDITLDDIKLESLTYQTYTPVQAEINSMLYPNPSGNEVFIDNRDGFSSLKIYTFEGRFIGEKQVYFGKNRISMSGMIPGTYYFSLSGHKKNETFRVIKQY